MTVSSLQDALVEVVRFLEEQEVPYAVMGAVGAATWGRSRATSDVDFTVLLNAAETERFEAAALERFSSLSRNPAQFGNTGLLRLRASNSFNFDIIAASIPFQEQLVRNAVEVTVASKQVKVARAEDVILLKLIAGRAIDFLDIEGIVRRQGGNLDRLYVESQIAELGELLNMELSQRWRRALSESGDSPQ